MNLDAVQNRIDRITARYDGDHDCSPDYPTVNWTDQQLVECIQALLNKIYDLQDRVTFLEEAK